MYDIQTLPAPRTQKSWHSLTFDPKSRKHYFGKWLWVFGISPHSLRLNDTYWEKYTISGSWGRLHSYLELFYSLVMVACPQLYDLLPPLSLKAPKVFSWLSLSFHQAYRPSTFHSPCQLHFILKQNRRLRLLDWAHGSQRLSPSCRECSYVLLGKICSFDVVHVVSHIVVVHCCTGLSLLKWC